MNNTGLLLLRLFAGGLMMTHGYDKFSGYNTMVGVFPDVIGIGSAMSLNLVIFAELFCAGLLVIGLFTRMALVPLIITMLVAVFIAHGADPLKKKELALLYLSCYGTLFMTGPGDFSFQRIFQISAGRFTWLLK